MPFHLLEALQGPFYEQLILGGGGLLEEGAVSPPGLGEAAQFFQGPAPVVLRPGELGVKGQGLVEILQGRGGFSQAEAGQPTIVNDLRVLQVQFQGLVIVRQGLLVLVLVEIGVTPVVIHFPVIGFEVQGRGVIGHGLVGFSLLGVDPAPVVEGLEGIGVERQGLVKILQGLVQLPLDDVGLAPVDISLRLIRVQLDGLGEQGHGLGPVAGLESGDAVFKIFFRRFRSIPGQEPTGPQRRQGKTKQQNRRKPETPCLIMKFPFSRFVFCRPYFPLKMKRDPGSIFKNYRTLYHFIQNNGRTRYLRAGAAPGKRLFVSHLIPGPP